MPRNGLPLTDRTQNAEVPSGTEPPHSQGEFAAREGLETTVLVAVESAQVREALVAILGTIDGFRIVAEADSDEAALEAARRQRPRLVLIEPELSHCRGWWAIQQIQAEQLAGVVVALGRRANDALARLAGAQAYVQMGVSPRDLLSALEAATAFRRPPVAGAQQDHLSEAQPDVSSAGAIKAR